MKSIDLLKQRAQYDALLTESLGVIEACYNLLYGGQLELNPPKELTNFYKEKYEDEDDGW